MASALHGQRHGPFRHGPVRRALRRFRLGSGPLKRGSDRIQVAARFLVVLIVFAAPAFAVWASTATTRQLEATAASQAIQRRHAHALVLETAVQPNDAADGSPVSVATQARWTAQNGRVRTGTVLVPVGTIAGTSVPIWVTRDGSLTTAPLDPASVQGAAVAMGALTLLGIPVLVFALYAGVTAALDAHRERRWTRGWAAVEPVWAMRQR